MAQCKKILENGERCSNRAVPGTEYCEEHRKIKFRKVPKTPPLPKQAEKKKTGKIEELPQWVARPSAAGDTPAFPELEADGRNILVAPQGMIWLGEQDGEDLTEPLFPRLVKLLACLSQEMPLPGHAAVWLLPEGSGALVRFTPPHHENTEFSRHYDVAAAAAALSGGALYVGEENTFIRYRDGSAPRGYDAEDVTVQTGNDVYLIDLDGTHLFYSSMMLEEPLADLLLRAAPLPLRGAELPDVAFVLVVPSLYRMLAKYFDAHHLQYRVARFLAVGRRQKAVGSQEHPPGPPQGGNSWQSAVGSRQSGDWPLMLFEVAPRLGAPAGTLVPKFVISYLTDLPCCSVFIEAGADEGRRMLVEWGRHYPCLPRHILGAFPQNSLLLFTSCPDFTNLCVSPAPKFFEGDALINVQAPRPDPASMNPVTDTEDLPFELPVRLIPDSGPTPSTTALILDAEETEWVCRLLYRLPGEAFGYYSFCMGQNGSVLMSEGMPVESLPFGFPMRRVQDTQLFLPLRARLLPELPWKVLAGALEIKETMYTFLTPDFRLDLPRDAFVPLSKALVAEPGRPRVVFKLRPVSGLPDVKWQKPEDMGKPTPGPSQEGKRARGGKQEGVFERLKSLGRKQSGKVQETEEAEAEQEKMLQDVRVMLREQAESLRQKGEHLSAALCFALCGEDGNAASCYKEAANQAKES